MVQVKITAQDSRSISKGYPVVVILDISQLIGTGMLIFMFTCNAKLVLFPVLEFL